jgi:hypothetical protein
MGQEVLSRVFRVAAQAGCKFGVYGGFQGIPRADDPAAARSRLMARPKANCGKRAGPGQSA